MVLIRKEKCANLKWSLYFRGFPEFDEEILGRGQTHFNDAVTMHILREGLPITQALLGEECEIFWRIAETGLIFVFAFS